MTPEKRTDQESLCYTGLSINIPEDARLIHFVEVPEASQPLPNDDSAMLTIDVPPNATFVTFEESLPHAVSAIDQDVEDYDPILLSKLPITKKHKATSEDPQDIDVSTIAPSVRYPAKHISQSKRLTEDYLFRRLVDNFHFGTFGGAIYVRSEEVYRLVTESSLSTLLLSILTDEEKEDFRMNLMSGVFARLTHDPEVSGNTLIIPEGKALFLNGAFDIVKRKKVVAKEHELYPFRIQANYRPDKELHGKHFKKFLYTASNGDAEVITRMMVMIGYFLVCGFTKTVWVAGCAPNSGKSVLGRWLTEVIGDSFAAAVPPQDMGSHFVIAQLAGSPVNLALDISKKALSDAVASFLKASSGEDKAVFNQKFQNATSQRYLCKHLFATNYPLKLQSYDRALWQRIQIVPFTVSTDPENQDRKLLKHLHQESDEIVTLAMEAIRAVILNKWQIPPCKVADEMKNIWIGWQVGADEFLAAYCEIEEGAFTSSRAMYLQYLQFCERYDFPIAEETGFILHVKNAFPQLAKRKRMFQGSQRHGFCDLKLRNL